MPCAVIAPVRVNCPRLFEPCCSCSTGSKCSSWIFPCGDTQLRQRKFLVSVWSVVRSVSGRPIRSRLRHPSHSNGCHGIVQTEQADQAKSPKPCCCASVTRGESPLLNFFLFRKEKLSVLSGLDSDNDCSAGLLEESRVWSVAWSVQTVVWSVMTRVRLGIYGSSRMWVGWACGEPMPSLRRFGIGSDISLDQCSSQRRRSAGLCPGARFS